MISEMLSRGSFEHLIKFLDPVYREQCCLGSDHVGLGDDVFLDDAGDFGFDFGCDFDCFKLPPGVVGLILADLGPVFDTIDKYASKHIIDLSKILCRYFWISPPLFGGFGRFSRVTVGVCGLGLE